MPENNHQLKPRFAGTYFEPDVVLRLARFLKISSWVVAIVYIFQLSINLGTFVLQLLRKLIYFNGPTEFLQQLSWQIQPSLAGLIFFVSLQAMAQVLLILMDIEDNTRRAARSK